MSPGTGDDPARCVPPLSRAPGNDPEDAREPHVNSVRGPFTAVHATTNVPRRGPMRPYPPLVVLLGAALLLVSPSATAQELGDRFAAAGADLRPGTSATLLGELTALGLVRASRREGDDTRHVITTLGRRYAEAEALDEEGRSRLIDLEALRTDLLSMIAHELRTPMTVIRTITGLLLDPASSPTDEQRRTHARDDGAQRRADAAARSARSSTSARFRSGTIGLQLRRFDATELASRSTSRRSARSRTARPDGSSSCAPAGPDHACSATARASSGRC